MNANTVWDVFLHRVLILKAKKDASQMGGTQSTGE